MFRAVSLNGALHYETLYFLMKNNAKHSHEGRHKVETKGFISEHQPITFICLLTSPWLPSRLPCILPSCNMQVPPSGYPRTDVKQTLTPGIRNNISS